MKAVRIHEFGDESVLRYEEVERPKAGKDEVLVQTAASSVNALDLKLRNGAMHGIIDYPLPFTLGCDVAGTVIDTGERVHDFFVGDRVLGMPAGEVGMYAEMAVLKASELARIPDGVDFATAATLPTCALTAWQALFEVGHLEPNQTVLIHGAAGGVGSLAVQLARWKGARIVATVAAASAAYVQGLGADQVIDYTSEPFEPAVSNVDFVLDLIGGETRTRSYATMKKGATLITVVPPFDFSDAPKEMELQTKGFGVHPDREQLHKVINMVAEKAIRVTISESVPLSEAARAHRLFRSGRQGKVVLHV